MEKISYDFDGTLDRGYFISGLAASEVSFGDEVYIITGRDPMEDNKAVFIKAQQLGIPKDRVHFTNGQLKGDIIKRLGIQKHTDDNYHELEDIKQKAPGVMTILAMPNNAVSNY